MVHDAETLKVHVIVEDHLVRVGQDVREDTTVDVKLGMAGATFLLAAAVATAVALAAATAATVTVAAAALVAAILLGAVLVITEPARAVLEVSLIEEDVSGTTVVTKGPVAAGGIVTGVGLQTEANHHAVVDLLVVTKTETNTLTETLVVGPVLKLPTVAQLALPLRTRLETGDLVLEGANTVSVVRDTTLKVRHGGMHIVHLVTQGINFPAEAGKLIREFRAKGFGHDVDVFRRALTNRVQQTSNCLSELVAGQGAVSLEESIRITFEHTTVRKVIQSVVRPVISADIVIRALRECRTTHDHQSQQ